MLSYRLNHNNSNYDISDEYPTPPTVSYYTYIDTCNKYRARDTFAINYVCH